MSEKKDDTWFSIKHEDKVVGKIKMSADYTAPALKRKPTAKKDPEAVKAPI